MTGLSVQVVVVKEMATNGKCQDRRRKKRRDLDIRARSSCDALTTLRKTTRQPHY
jgi:hypothetical protein